MTQNRHLADLSEAGVSVWLDDLSRDRLRSGNLQELIDTKSVVGVTTNPSIFQAALSKGTAYDAQVAEHHERPGVLPTISLRLVAELTQFPGQVELENWISLGRVVWSSRLPIVVR